MPQVVTMFGRGIPVPAGGVEVRVINLRNDRERWRAMRRHLLSAGFNALRHEAVNGAAMGSDERQALYDPALNRRQYHRPLEAGEIGCYASHLAVWSELVASKQPHAVVLEDDVEVDAALPKALAAIASHRGEWDLIKLIGRDHEKVRERWPLVDSHALISYRRVPSLTGAYVVSAEGARKLLAARRPFGRPVDVDLRYWWECGLVIRGVHPYPAQRAPWSDISTIDRRDCRRPGTVRLKKILLQAKYSWRNHFAGDFETVRHEPPVKPPTEPPSTLPIEPPIKPPIYSPTRAFGSPVMVGVGVGLCDTDKLESPARNAAALRSVPRLMPTVDSVAREASSSRSRRRNLVVLRAGDESLHRQWIDSATRDFDLFISYYGRRDGQHRADADFYEARPGPKWPGIAALLEERPELVEQYDAFWFPDDDLAIDAAQIDRLFAFVCAYRLCLAQPALTKDSYFTWDTLLQDPNCHLRYTRFVEVMAPVFSRDALRACRHTFAQSTSGWGLDWVWPTLCARAELGRIAIVDATPVHHTRPVGGGSLYRDHPEMQPRQEAQRLLRAYGIEEVRAVAKYSFEGGVRDVPLPPRLRLLYWIKRLNGRRKHRPA